MFAKHSKNSAAAGSPRCFNQFRHFMSARTGARIRSTRIMVALICLVLCIISLRLWVGTAQGPSIAINIDAAVGRHNINPNIYGVAFASPAQLADLNAPLNRSGGNTETRYNWQLNAHNHGADWYFESLDDGPTNAAASADQFVTDSKNGGAQPMLTIPMLGWVPKLGPSRTRLSSFSIAKYGQQADHDWEWFPDAGNG